ncbi:MAG: hypothetical protein Q9M89_03355 [Persephonella sp.]|nr:hypothetical protein [Persephonella sp.]
MLLSCENYYAKFYDESIKNREIDCLKVENCRPFLVNKIVKALKEEGIVVKDSCPYTLSVTSKFLSQCTSPHAKSVDADFDGYLRFDLKKEGRLLYRIQMDWKGEFSEGRIKRLIDRMKKDIKFKSLLNFVKLF